MHRTFLGGAVIAALVTLGTITYAQQPPAKRSPDRSPPAGDAPRIEPRGEVDGALPPGKAGRRGRGEASDGPPEGPPRAFGGGGFSRSGGPQGGGFGGGFGGGMRGGGYGGGGGGFGMPGMPGPFGPWPAGDDPEMQEVMKQDADLEGQAQEMAERVRQARGDERNKLKSDLTKVVNTQFEVRQKRRQLQLKRMEEELHRLREAIDKRSNSRESIVENHIRELIGEPRDLDF